MEIIFDIVGKVIVEDNLYVVHIDSARRNVCSNENVEAATS